MNRARLILAGLVAALAAPAVFAVAPAACDRNCLIGLADRTLKALAAHDPSTLPVASDLRVTVNGDAADLRSPALAGIDAFPFRQFAADPETGTVAVIGVAEEHFQRGTFFLRVKLRQGNIAEAEIIAGPRGDDAVPGLISPNPLFDLALSPSQKRSRKVLQQVADSYFEGLERHDGSKVPVSGDCRRFEDGVQTSLNPVFMPGSCNNFAPYTYMDHTAGRAYPIIDVDRGLVVGQMVIQVSTPKGPPATSNVRRVNPASGMVMPPNPLRSQPRNTIIQELFKIIDGRITEIQAIRMDRPYGTGDGWRVPRTAPAP